MSERAIAGSIPLLKNVERPRETVTAASVLSQPADSAPWGYRWRAYVLFLSQLPAAMVGSACGLSECPWYYPDFHPVRAWTGVAIACLGLALRVWGTAHLSVKTMGSSSADGDELISTGPYRICRNPLYLGSLLMCVAYGLLFGWLFAAIFTALHFWRYGSIVRYEEDELRRSFPGPFANYAAKVSRWLPNLFDRNVWQGPFVSQSAIWGNSLFVGLWLALIVCACTRYTFLFGAIELLAVIPMIWHHLPQNEIIPGVPPLSETAEPELRPAKI